jgi:glutamate formiminotransferase/glutamate formiminotransferase/formiminotetrahydrofolate cyclodeaminase
MQLECVINISEGRRADVVAAIAGAAGSTCLDVHSDGDHNRSVLTLAGDARAVEDAARAVARETVARIDITMHKGAHPYRGALDVVPFVPWTGATLADAIDARDRFAEWAVDELDIHCLLYGPEMSLPELRRIAPVGTTAVGARPPLVAYNLWLERGTELATAKAIATEIRVPGKLRTLGLQVGDDTQVSCNLIDPFSLGPADAFDAVAARAAVARAELVGLVPAAVLAAVPTGRWKQLDLAPSRTVETRLGEVQAGPN